MNTITPTVGKIHRTNGVAGQVIFSTTIDYGDGPEPVTLVGSTYGGPVLMILPSGMQIFVDDPGRFGVFGPQWVREFFG